MGELISGGAGETYSSFCSGTEAVSGSPQAVTKSYAASGTKLGKVRVTSGSQFVEVYSSLAVLPAVGVETRAAPNPAFIDVDNVAWNSMPVGGAGSFIYSWAGDDNLSGATQSLTKVYQRAGEKRGTVTVTSGQASASASAVASLKVPPPPTVDVKVNGGDGSLEVDAGFVAVSWSTTNAVDCAASRALSGV